MKSKDELIDLILSDAEEFNAYNNEMSFLKGRHFVIIGDRVLNSK